ncbi:MAG TPA: hypothetical protein VNK82_09615 [Terriglobales bacterium]|nr:hypothetical protein [Terriglobales bacterium]
MKKLVLWLAFTLVSSALSVGQNTGSAAGLRIPVVLKNSVDARGPLGATVLLECREDVRVGDNVVIPKKARLTGRVIKAVPWTDDRRESVLSVVVERADWKDGSLELKAFIADGLQVMRNEWTRRWSAARPHMYVPSIDKSVSLRRVEDPEIVSEVVSDKHNLKMDPESKFVLGDTLNR